MKHFQHLRNFKTNANFKAEVEIAFLLTKYFTESEYLVFIAKSDNAFKIHI